MQLPDLTTMYTQCVVKPQFIDGPSGQLFVCVFQPETGVSNNWIVHVPAFAEEMNKSRSMVSLQARALACQGYTVVVPDLFGTGDSAGDFSDTNWECWKEDIKSIVERALHSGAQTIKLWGLRLGALLAADVSQELLKNYSGIVQGLIFWQPVLDGKQTMTQFLRLRMAATMASGKKETVGELRDRCMAGESIEVAGYILSPTLLSQIDSIAMKNLRFPKGSLVYWYEVANVANKPLLLPSRQLITEWEFQDIQVLSYCVKGESFWMTQEICMVPTLIDSLVANLPDINLLSPVLTERLSEPKNFFIEEELERSRLKEYPVLFQSEGCELVGVFHDVVGPAKKGVVLIVGGPQYRVGSHRQFVLLARFLSKHGIPVLRFDYSGMGDSSGNLIGFEGIETDIRSAVDQLVLLAPGLESVVLWGLCDAATAASLYAPLDDRVKGVVLLNPWIRSSQSEAKAHLKHYYFKRFFSKGLWQKIIGGQFSIGISAREFFSKLKILLDDENVVETNTDSGTNSEKMNMEPLSVQIYKSLKQYSGFGLIILSGNDLTSAEFVDELNSNKNFKKLIAQNCFSIFKIKGADHTFSRKAWRCKVECRTLEWVQSW